jgi:GntR family transcriptional regulator/MocR family aminotransferase
MPQCSMHPPWSGFAPDRSSSVSLQDQIAGFFRDAIAAGRVRAGLRVSSSRQLAADFGISRTTVVAAYDRLIAEGWFITRPGAGVFVADSPPKQAGRCADAASPAVAPPPDLKRIDMRNYLLPLAPGMPAIDRFPWATWARLTSQVCRERPLNAVGYGDPQGELPLRQAVADYLATTRGLVCDAGQIIVSAGSELTLQFVLRQVTSRGDAVWVEDPCGTYMRTLPRGAGLQPVPVPVDRDGMDVAEGIRRAPHARLAIVSPTHQYPTGATLSPERRRALVEWCEASGAWIYESEIDGDYRFTSRAQEPIYNLSLVQRVFYCGSLSKPLAPGLRTNYLVVPRALMPGLALTTTLAPMLNQLVLARFNAAGHLALHMRRMRTLYAKRRGVLLEELRRQAGDCLEVPHVSEGGLRVLTLLRHGLDDVALSQACLAAGIKVDPLSICHADTPRSGLIIGFASTPEERIPAAVGRLVAVCRRELDLKRAHELALQQR